MGCLIGTHTISYFFLLFLHCNKICDNLINDTGITNLADLFVTYKIKWKRVCRLGFRFILLLRPPRTPQCMDKYCFFGLLQRTEGNIQYTNEILFNLSVQRNFVTRRFYYDSNEIRPYSKTKDNVFLRPSYLNRRGVFLVICSVLKKKVYLIIKLTMNMQYHMNVDFKIY